MENLRVRYMLGEFPTDEKYKTAVFAEERKQEKQLCIAQIYRTFLTVCIERFATLRESVIQLEKKVNACGYYKAWREVCTYAEYYQNDSNRIKLNVNVKELRDEFDDCLNLVETFRSDMEKTRQMCNEALRRELSSMGYISYPLISLSVYIGHTKPISFTEDE